MITKPRTKHELQSCRFFISANFKFIAPVEKIQNSQPFTLATNFTLTNEKALINGLIKETWYKTERGIYFWAETVFFFLPM